MADIKAASDFVLRQEDSTLSGEITNIASDAGGRTRFGISERWHPELTETGFFDTMPVEEALAKAEEVYAASYATPLQLASIASQPIATAMMSFAVVQGLREAVTRIQRAAESLGARIAVDGQLGPATLAAINSLEAPRLLAAFCELEEAFFRNLVAINPSQSVFLSGWLNRAQANAALA